MTDLTPSVGVDGESTIVVISGNHFSATPGDNSVTFNGVSANVTVATETSLTVLAPPNAETGPVVVTVSGVIAAKRPVFTYLDGLCDQSAPELVVTNFEIGAVVKTTDGDDNELYMILYTLDISNGGGELVDLDAVGAQATIYPGGEEEVGSGVAASGWFVGDSSLASGQTFHFLGSSNSGGMSNPLSVNGALLVVEVTLYDLDSRPVSECNSENNSGRWTIEVP